MLHKCVISLVFFSVLLEITKCADLFWLFICYSFTDHCLVSPISKTQATNGKWSQAPWPWRGCQPWTYRYEVPNIQKPRRRTGGKARCPVPAEDASLGCVVMRFLISKDPGQGWKVKPGTPALQRRPALGFWLWANDSGVRDLTCSCSFMTFRLFPQNCT